MKYLVEVRKAKQEDKFFYCPFNEETYKWENRIQEGATTITEFPVILAEISETDFSEAIRVLSYKADGMQDNLDYWNEKHPENTDTINDYEKRIPKLQSAISILKHLST